MAHVNLERNILFGPTRNGLLKRRFCLTGAPKAASATKADELSSARPYEEMPTVPIKPLLGSGWIYLPIIGRYDTRRLHVADRLKHQMYGDVVREKLGSTEIVNSFSPEAMEVIFRNEGPYPDKVEFSSLIAYRNVRPKRYKTLGIMLLQGKDWYDLRSKVQKHLMKPKAIQAYLEPMQQVARDMASLIKHKRDSKNEVPDFLEELNKWALESVAFLALDTRLGCIDSDLPNDSDGYRMINSVRTQFHCMGKLEFRQHWQYFPTPTWLKFKRAADVFTEIAFKYINRSLDALKNAGEDKELTLLQSMILTKGLDISGAMVTVADMLLGGIDTTSNTVGFLFYHLAKNPDKQNTLFGEIRQLLPRREDKITPENFNQFHYLKACLKESIRLHPIIRGNARKFDHDVVISGYKVPAGTVVFYLFQVASRNPKYFRDPDSFLPERWLDRGSKEIHPFAYSPFGIGPRSCVGRRLVELEIVCLTAEVLRNFHVEYHYEDLDMYTGLINIPDRPLRFSFSDR